MAVKIMQKPYNLVCYDEKGVETYRLTVMPPSKTGINEDGKNPKDQNGNWIRQFTVTDVGNSTYSVGDKITMYTNKKYMPTKKLEDNTTLKLEVIEGVVSTKNRKPKVKDVVDDNSSVTPVNDVETEVKEDETVEVETEVTEEV